MQWLWMCRGLWTKCALTSLVASGIGTAEGIAIAIRGSCLCGGVTFEIDRACGPAEYCHCNRCRKVSGSSSLLNVRVRTQDHRLLTGRELIKSYAAPILYSPPAYHSYFCSNCGSQVPPSSPEEESFEIA